MQKFTFLILFTVISFWLNAQASYQLFDLQGVEITNDTITVNGSTSDNEVYFYAHIKNISSSSKKTICKKTVFSTDGSDMDGFCFGSNCYSGNTSSQNPVTIEAGVTDTTFDSYVFPDTVGGVTTILYTFYTQQDTADSVNVLVNFNIQNTSAIVTNKIINTSLGNPYPLPANDYVKFDYSLKQGNIASIIFYDILGTEVSRHFLASNLNQIKINTAEFKTGVFVYALIVNGKKTKMGRLMVKH